MLGGERKPFNDEEFAGKRKNKMKKKMKLKERETAVEMEEKKRNIEWS